MKNCNICKSSKPFSEFSKSNSPKGDGYQYTCKLCNTTEKRKWREANQDKNRNTKYLKKFGITLEQALAILKSQNNTCAICKAYIEMGSKTHLDHCHLTGKVRGFLCQKCNHGLGLFNDSIQALKNAIEYISHHETKL
jgi:hypothetical protein